MGHHYLLSKSSIFPFLTKASPTDGRTDGQTDGTGYRDGRTHLKTLTQLKMGVIFSASGMSPVLTPETFVVVVVVVVVVVTDVVVNVVMFPASGSSPVVTSEISRRHV